MTAVKTSDIDINSSGNRNIDDNNGQNSSDIDDIVQNIATGPPGQAYD